MASPLSNLVNNLSEGLHRIKCKLEHDDKKCETCGIATVFSNIQILICLSCNKNSTKVCRKVKRKIF